MNENMHGFLLDIKWIMFVGVLDFGQTHLNEMVRTQNWKTMTLQNITPLFGLGLRLMCPPGVHCDNIGKQRVGKYRVINIHKRKT